MRRIAVLLLLLVAGLAGCDRGGSRSDGAVSASNSSSANGLSLTVSFDEPLQAGRPIVWALQVENRGKGPVTLRFKNGKDGDVALLAGGREAYRWSANRLFSQALREVALEAGAGQSFKLEERALGVPAGDYELVAEVASDPSPGTVRRPVTVR